MGWLRPHWKAVAVSVFAAALASFLVVGCGGGIEEKVSDQVGESVECEKIGVMDIAGEREDVYRCATPTDYGEGGVQPAIDGEPVGCYALVDGDLYEVCRSRSARWRHSDSAAVTAISELSTTGSSCRFVLVSYLQESQFLVLESHSPGL
jgi:hypothetical protein